MTTLTQQEKEKQQKNKKQEKKQQFEKIWKPKVATHFTDTKFT